MSNDLYAKVARKANARQKVNYNRHFNSSNTPLLPSNYLQIVNKAPKLAFNTHDVLTRSGNNVVKFSIEGDTDEDPEEYLIAFTAYIRQYFSRFPSLCDEAVWDVEQGVDLLVLTATYSGISNEDFIAQVIKSVPQEMETASGRVFSITSVTEKLITVDSFLLVYPIYESCYKLGAFLSMIRQVDPEPRLFTVKNLRTINGTGYTIVNLSYSGTRLPPSSGKGLSDSRVYDPFHLYPLTYRGSYCRFCKSKEHIREQCQVAPECLNCKSRTHPSRRCTAA